MNITKTVLGWAALAATAALGVVVAWTPETSAQQAKAEPAKVEAIVKGIFGKAPPQWQAKVPQDETQAQCSQYRGAPPPAVAQQILAREKKTVVLPADGQFIGNWKKGEALAQNGYGGRHTDDPKREMGGNCYACHQLSKTELSFGTMGPPLVEYGKLRKFAPEAARDAYIKIFNAQAVFPCSNMPRLGLSKHLTEAQIKDIVALLFDPDSPVNK